MTDFVLGADVLYTRLHRMSAEVKVGARAITRSQGLQLLGRIRSRASGRPGPNVITGQYRASWGVRYDDNGVVAQSRVGTDAPQARRLEYGFVDTDSLGRHYAQPPFPHVQPSLDDTERAYRAEMAAMLAKVIT